MRYELSDFRKAIRDPRKLLREANFHYHTRFGRRKFNPDGIDIFTEDWDNLIILDACRYDYFRDYHDLPGTLERRVSRGGTSSEFIVGNFAGKTLHDTVYVSGNSWYARLCREINSEVHEFSLITDPYPEKPGRITEEANLAAESFPRKRLLVHYMLPHSPYIGPTAKRIEDEMGADLTVSEKRRGNLDVPDELLGRLYRENLEIVLPKIAELLDTLPGRTVVTADHGELLGDRLSPIPHKDYGHIRGLYVPELVEIPWLICDTGDRKEIESTVPERDNLEGISNEKVLNHLRDLGYRV